MTTQHTPDHNPFLLMVNPEVVLSAMEKSERLNQLTRQLCRPLDRPAPPAAGKIGSADDAECDFADDNEVCDGAEDNETFDPA